MSAPPNLSGSSSSTSTHTTQASRLKARPVPASTFNSAMFANTPASASIPQSSFTPLQPLQPFQPTQSSFSPTTLNQSSFAPLQPTPRPALQSSTPSTSGAPNYNISLTPSAPSPRPAQPQPMSFMSPPALQQRTAPTPPMPSQAPGRPPPGYTSGLMQPTVRPKPSIPTVNGKQDWGDFDPLK